MNNLNKYINKLENHKLEDHQKKRIKIIVERLYNKINSISLIVFICTHNSRRSQFCETWSKVLANRYGLNISFSSAGTTKTSVYKEVINSLKRAGVDINEKGILNIEGKSSILYSKTLDDIKENKFISITNCKDAERNCPLDPRSQLNLNIFYDDPKKFDGMENEKKEYDKTCLSIAAEINVIFKSLVNSV